LIDRWTGLLIDGLTGHYVQGGLAQQILGEGVTILEFPEMDHGWTVRGNLSIPAVQRDVNKALTEAIAFFNKHL